MAEPLYTREMLRLAAATAGLSRLTSPDATAERKSPVCGSRVTVDITLDEAGQVSGFGAEVRACAMGQAAMWLVAHRARGLSADEVERSRAAFAAWLGSRGALPADWPELAIFDPARRHSARHAAILLPFDALAAAIAQARVQAPA
jgi:NifU-like protein involved in Fe-S cluster formation